MKKQYFILEHRNSAAFLSLKTQLEEQKRLNLLLSRRVSELENLYGCEVMYNNALCDLLKSHGIAFRQVFSHEYRLSKF